MEEDDPFGSIAELCQVSSSQESLLRHCRFFCQAEASAFSASDGEGEYDDPAYIPVDSTGITMVSPPESADNENMHLEDLFHTPPEGSLYANHGEDHRTVDGGLYGDGDTVPVDAYCADNMTAVDLGRDTDLGFSEVELESTQRMDIHSDQNVAFQSEPDEARVSKSEFSPAEQSLGESPFKRLKISSFESPDIRLATVQEKPKEEFLKTSEKLKSVSVSPSPIDLSGTSGNNTNSSETLEFPLRSCEAGEGIHNSREELLKSSEIKSKSVRPVRSGNVARMGDSFGTLELQSHLPCGQVGEFSHTKRGLEFSTEVIIDSEIEERNIESCIKGISDGEKMNMEDIHKFRYTGANYSKLCEKDGKAKGKRVLPSRIYATARAAASSKTTTQGAAAATSSNTAREDTAVAATSLMIVTEGTAGNLSESDVLPEKKSRKTFLLDVLQALVKDDGSCNENLKHLSLMEVLKRRGTAFTQPSWWPKEGLEVKK